MSKLLAKSMDRVYTAFRLLESLGDLLTHSQWIRIVHIETLFVCLFTKFEVCCLAQTIFMRVLEEYLDIHNNIFQIEGAMMEWKTVWVSFSPIATNEG